MRVGWLQDRSQIQGGAEVTGRLLKAAKPADVEIVECPAEDVSPGLDAYVVMNCVGYQAKDCAPMDGAPVLRYIQDAWPHGDPELRTALLETADRILMLSPLHLERFRWPVDEAKVSLVPPPIEVERFRSANASRRSGNVWVGQMTWHGYGIDRAAEWGIQNGGLDFYGDGPLRPPMADGITDHPAVPYDKVARLLARYERFVFLPTLSQPFGRSVVEAWAAGCKLVVNDNVGAKWWIENRPAELDSGAKSFWQHVAEIAGRTVPV